MVILLHNDKKMLMTTPLLRSYYPIWSTNDSEGSLLSLVYTEIFSGMKT